MTTIARGRWIPWTYAGGMLVVIAVNAVLITMALRSFPGLVVQRPYDRGIAYNDELRQDRAQAALGWSLSPSYDAGRLSVGIKGADGLPVLGLDVQATMSRPLESILPIDVTLRAEGERYAGDVVLPMRGQWDVKVQASGAPGTYRGLYRMTVK